MQSLPSLQGSPVFFCLSFWAHLPASVLQKPELHSVLSLHFSPLAFLGLLAHVLPLQKPERQSFAAVHFFPLAFLPEPVETHLLLTQEPDWHSSDRSQNAPFVAGAWHVELPFSALARHMGLLISQSQSSSAVQFGSFGLSYWHFPLFEPLAAIHFKSLAHVRPPGEDFASAVEQLSPSLAAHFFRTNLKIEISRLSTTCEFWNENNQILSSEYTKFIQIMKLLNFLKKSKLKDNFLKRQASWQQSRCRWAESTGHSSTRRQISIRCLLFVGSCTCCLLCSW